MNQELIDRIQQDAVTIQRLTADLDSIKQEQASNASDYKDKLQAEELRYSRLLSETSAKLIGCGKRIDSLENHLETVRKCARTNGWTEKTSLADFVSSQAAEIAKHKEDAEQISKSLGSSISLANSRALEIDALKHDVAREHERGNRINSEYEASISNIMAAASKLGRADYESPDAFMQRQASEIARLRSRLSEEINDAYKCAGTLGRLSTETVTDFMKRQHAEIEKEQQRNVQMAERLSLVMQDYQDKSQQLLKVQGWHEENLQKIRELTAKHTVKTLAEIFDTAKKHGRRSDETVSEFIIRQEALLTKHGNEARALYRKNIDLQSEMAATTKRLQAGEFTWNTYGQLCNFATSCGMTGDESVKQFIERKIIEASTVTADRDRIRAELAAILAEANKSGRCNGDPLQLLKAGQSDLDARLSAEREAEDIKKRWRSLNEHAALKGMRGDETTAEFITRQHRLAADRQTALDRASETIATLTSDLTSAIVDKALAGNGATEVARLSALVAELQVELDDAKSQYGGIMAQLGNETPLQLIERMQRLAQDRRASTIPHDERAMLVAESADLRKRLEASQKAHAKTEHELGGKLRAALATVENQSAAIAEAKQATEQYTAAVEALAKLKEWASTVRHKVMVKVVHDRAMAEYDTIMKELDGGKVPQ